MSELLPYTHEQLPKPPIARATLENGGTAWQFVCPECGCAKLGEDIRKRPMYLENYVEMPMECDEGHRFVLVADVELGHAVFTVARWAPEPASASGRQRTSGRQLADPDKVWKEQS